jgi:hypothetical protein
VFTKNTLKAYNLRIGVAQILFQMTTAFYKQYVQSIQKQMPQESNAIEIYLRKHYGRAQSHSMATYLENLLVRTYHNLNFLDGERASLPNMPKSRYIPRGVISQRNFDDEKCDPKHQPCTMDCIIPNFWATRIYNALKTIKSKLALNNLQRAICNFEHCYKCLGDFRLCSNYDMCDDNLNYLCHVAVHFPTIRTMLRKFYKIFAAWYVLISIDESSSHNSSTNSINSSMEIGSDKQQFYDIKYIDSLIAIFKKDLLHRLQITECNSCHKFLAPSYLTHLPKKISPKQRIILHELFGHLNDSQELLICRNYCYKDIFTLNRVPIYSFLNNMMLGQLPVVYKNLNIYEKLLLQRARVFQTTFRLQSHIKSSRANCIPALRGLAVHLPLTTTETHQYISDTLPNYDCIKIIINSLPTKTQKIWRSIVDLDKVYAAAEWLKHNNSQYKDISILPKNNIRLYSLMSFEKTSIQSEKDDNSTSADSYLNLATDFLNPRQFTICDLDKINVNDTDINKYNMKRIDTKPLDFNNVNLDHWCFPELFPYGRGGMFDTRNVPIKPAMYYRWILMNKNPLARRNQQYVFSALNNKDIRAAEGGVFTQINSVRGKKFAAADFFAKLDANDKELEANLTTIMSPVRNSKEYWANVSSNLNAFNQSKGPATFFCTLNPAEYAWTDLRDFLLNHCSDVTNVHLKTLADLINLEPGLVAFYFNQRFNSFFTKVKINFF